VQKEHNRRGDYVQKEHNRRGFYVFFGHKIRGDYVLFAVGATYSQSSYSQKGLKFFWL
jgi:hypothetical protein